MRKFPIQSDWGRNQYEIITECNPIKTCYWPRCILPAGRKMTYLSPKYLSQSRGKFTHDNMKCDKDKDIMGTKTCQHVFGKVRSNQSNEELGILNQFGSNWSRW